MGVIQMKENLKLLDCTLRDGGFVNDWKFGKLSIRSLVSRLDTAGIDIIEVGFLDDSVTYDEDRSLFPNIQSIAKTLGKSLPKQSELVAMIDLGHFSKELFISQKDSVINGIRLIFQKEFIKKAINFANQIKNYGYKLFLNPVSLTSYSDMEILELVMEINRIKPEAISIVDTYGLMFRNDIKRYIYLIDGNLDSDIALGYHSHNNVQMANANCIEIINMNLRRNIIIDTSILGMGKSAGNACTELIAAYLDKNNIKQVDLDQVLEYAYTDIMRFQGNQEWGYNIEFLISAIHDCSPNWPKYLMNQNTLSIKNVRSIISSLPSERRMVSYYSKQLAQQRYLEFIDNSLDDSFCKNELKKIISDKKVLLLCPGNSLNEHSNKIYEYIEKNHPVVVTVNFITDIFISDYAFISNSRRYSQMISKYLDLHNKPKILLTSNITPVNNMVPEMIFNYKVLYDIIGQERSNSTILLLALLQSIGVKYFAIAGFDGFSIDINNNYFENNVDLSIGLQAEKENDVTINQFNALIEKNAISLNWLTPSIFNGKR